MTTQEPENIRVAREKINAAAMEVRRHLRTLPEFGKKHRIGPGVMIDYMTPADSTASDLRQLEDDVQAYFTKER